MWFKIFLTSIAAVLLGLNCSIAMAQDNTYQNQSTSQQPSDSQQKDAKIFGILMVLNRNEINAAKLAESKTSNTAVKKFAEKMQNNHSKNLDKEMSLEKDLSIQPLTSNISIDLQKNGEEEAR